MNWGWISLIVQHFHIGLISDSSSFPVRSMVGGQGGSWWLYLIMFKESHGILSRCQAYSWDPITNAVLLSRLPNYCTKARPRKCPADTLAGDEWEKITNLEETCCLLFFIMRAARVYTEQASGWYWDTEDLNESHMKMSFAIWSNKRDWSLGR